MEKAKTRKIKKWDDVNGEYEVEVTAGVGPSISKNPMRSIEDMVEQNDNNLDGVINNVKADSGVGTLENVSEEKKSVLEKLKEQNMKLPPSVTERKQVPGCCFEREMTGW